MCVSTIRVDICHARSGFDGLGIASNSDIVFRPHYPAPWNGSDGPYQQKPVKPPRGDRRIKPRASISNHREQARSFRAGTNGWRLLGVGQVHSAGTKKTASHWKLSKAKPLSLLFQALSFWGRRLQVCFDAEQRQYPGVVGGHDRGLVSQPVQIKAPLDNKGDQ
ncbi:hypothetical protein NW767_012134 [Fusarium falciforme]|nr:hypothetical protein NW767_012134 [Fusarium falciforme]